MSLREKTLLNQSWQGKINEVVPGGPWRSLEEYTKHLCIADSFQESFFRWLQSQRNWLEKLAHFVGLLHQ